MEKKIDYRNILLGYKHFVAYQLPSLSLLLTMGFYNLLYRQLFGHGNNVRVLFDSWFHKARMMTTCSIRDHHL